MVLISRDMDGGGVLKGALKNEGATLMQGAGAVYISDVSGMPGLVRKLMVMPSLRRRGYLILIDEKGTATELYPTEKGQTTLIAIEKFKITSIEFFDAADELRLALETRALPEPKSP